MVLRRVKRIQGMESRTMMQLETWKADTGRDGWLRGTGGARTVNIYPF